MPENKLGESISSIKIATMKKAYLFLLCIILTLLTCTKEEKRVELEIDHFKVDSKYTGFLEMERKITGVRYTVENISPYPSPETNAAIKLNFNDAVIWETTEAIPVIAGQSKQLFEVIIDADTLEVEQIETENLFVELCIDASDQIEEYHENNCCQIIMNKANYFGGEGTPICFLIPKK